AVRKVRSVGSGNNGDVSSVSGSGSGAIGSNDRKSKMLPSPHLSSESSATNGRLSHHSVSSPLQLGFPNEQTSPLINSSAQNYWSTDDQPFVHAAGNGGAAMSFHNFPPSNPLFNPHLGSQQRRPITGAH